VHRLVLEDRVGCLSANEPRDGGIVDGGELECALDALVASSGKGRNPAAIRPLVIVASRLVSVCRIDAALEETLESGIDRRLAEPALVEGEKAERRNVTFVERKRMAQRNRPFVERPVVDKPEKRRGPFAISAIPVEQTGPI
jgi:hypothetical protein